MERFPGVDKSQHSLLGTNMLPLIATGIRSITTLHSFQPLSEYMECYLACKFEEILLFFDFLKVGISFYYLRNDSVDVTNTTSPIHNLVYQYLFTRSLAKTQLH